jgi:hypothetical protein
MATRSFADGKARRVAEFHAFPALNAGSGRPSAAAITFNNGIFAANLPVAQVVRRSRRSDRPNRAIHLGGAM